jgi:hypothetical protein
MEDKTVLRVTVMAVLIAILFGILQYVPSEAKWTFFGIEGLLAVFAKTLFGTAFIFFILYLILIIIENTHTFSRNDRDDYLSRVTAAFYDIGAVITLGVMFMLIGLIIIINVTNKFSSFLNNYIALFLILIVMGFGILSISILIGRIIDHLRLFDLS